MRELSRFFLSKSKMGCEYVKNLNVLEDVEILKKVTRKIIISTISIFFLLAQRIVHCAIKKKLFSWEPEALKTPLLLLFRVSKRSLSSKVSLVKSLKMRRNFNQTSTSSFLLIGYFCGMQQPHLCSIYLNLLANTIM